MEQNEQNPVQAEETEDQAQTEEKAPSGPEMMIPEQENQAVPSPAALKRMLIIAFALAAAALLWMTLR